MWDYNWIHRNKVSFWSTWNKGRYLYIYFEFLEIFPVVISHPISLIIRHCLVLVTKFQWLPVTTVAYTQYGITTEFTGMKNHVVVPQTKEFSRNFSVR